MTRGAFRIIVGDCLTELVRLPAGYFHACMTSPPYFALRSYLPAGHADKGMEIGSEPTPEAFIQTMVAVFMEVRRVLRDDGFLWINLGDSYDAGTFSPRKASNVADHGYWANSSIDQRVTGGLPAGSQLLMPHRVALALQADGWVLRDTVIWSKRSPMPSSQNGVRWERCRVKVAGTKWDGGNAKNADTNDGNCNFDAFRPHLQAKWEPCPGCDKCRATCGYVLRRGQGRTTTAHEYLFLFTKGNGYFWDMENCREAVTGGANPRRKDGSYRSSKGRASEDNRDSVVRTNDTPSTRIPRSVWTLSSEPTKFNHFATYPSELVRRCLMPLSPRGCCPACGAQWAPVVEQVTEPLQVYGNRDREFFPGRTGNGVQKRASEVPATSRVIGYRPTCDCPAADPAPCRVIDPFSGTGTTGQTACFLGHEYTGIELNPEYVAFTQEWIMREPRWSLRTKVKSSRKIEKPMDNQQMLFQVDGKT